MGIWTKDDESKDSLVDVASERSTTFPASPARLSLTSPRFSIHGSHANSDSGHLDSHRFSNFSQVLDPMASPRRYSDASAYSMSFVTADFGAGTGGDPYDGEKEERDLKAEPEFQAASKGAGTPTAVGSVPYFQLFKFADTLDWLLVILGSIAAILHGLMMPAGIYVLSKIVGKLGAGTFDGEAYRQVTKVVLILVYLALQALWLSVVEVSCWTIAGDRQSGRIRAKYLESLLRQEVAFYDTEMTTGEIVHQISSDSLQIHEAIGEKVASFIHNVSTFVGGLVFMLVEVWQLGLINVCFMPLTLGVAITYTKIYSKFAIRSAASLQEGSSVMEQAISQVRTVYSYVGEMRAVQALSQVLDTTVRLGRGGGLAKGLGMGMSLALSNIQWAIVFWVGALLVTGGSKIQGSDILATALTAMYTAMGLSSSLRDVETFLNGKIAAYRIFKIIDRKPLIDALGQGGDTLLSLKGELELSNVHFAYPARPDVPIFKGLNLKIPAAKTVALVGTSGSGKSTVIQLIERFYDPSFGVVKLDGVDIKSLQLKWLRSQMGLVGQEPVLFSTTIRQNIMHGKEGSSEQDVISAATAANAHTFIKNFPEQYDTQVGERGAQLSGGQKQRVAIARAVLKNPAILLLDEATSALDTEAEKVVQQAINNVMHGRTTVIIAHRLSTIQHSDLIAVFDRGQIAEIGTHSELLRKGGSGVYYNLVNLQATSEIKTRNPSTSAPHSPLARRSFQTSPMPPRRSFHGSPSTATTLARRSFHSILLKDAYDHSPYSERASPQLEQVRFAASPAVSEMMSPNSAFSVALSPLPPEPSHVETDKGHREMDKEERAKRIPAGDILGLFRGELVIAVVAVVASAIAGVFTPVFSVFSIKTVFYFYGRYTMEQIKHGVAKDCLIFVGLGVGSLFAHAAQHVASNRLGSTISKRTQEKAFSALLENEVGWFDREQNSSAMVTSRLSTDTSVIKIALSERLAFLIQYITAIVVAVAVAFTFSWRMTLVCLTVIPLAMFNGGMRHAFTSSGLSGSTKLAQEKSTQVAAEAVSNIRTVASLGVEGKMVTAFQTEVEGAKKERTRKAFQGAVFMGLAHFSAMSANGLVLWYAAFLLRAGQATFVSALVVFQVMGSTSFQLIESLKIFQDLTRAANATVTTINTIYRGSLINPTTGSEPDAEIVGAIHLQDVSFAYPSRPDIPILQRLNLLIPPNSTTALVGPSGSGKSSIVQLIERFYDPDKGRVLLDGKDIKTLNLRWLRQHIALVQQEPALFATSIRENIRYGKQNATETEITEAAKAANAHRFISGLPDGYDTEVGERGAQLSGGQKQRIAIARAVLKNPKVLLLDEATSALDAESERVVQEALDRLMQGRRTTIVIAHRLSTIQKVPHIAVINQGQVVESGTHVTLLRSRGTYAKLVQLQDLNTSQD